MRKTASLISLCVMIWGAAFADPMPDQECAFPSASTVSAAKAEANIVFTGEFVDLNTNWVSSGYKLTFKVDQSWVRTTEPFITVNFPVNASCDIPFSEGEKYLVFVYKKFALKTDCCMPNMRLSEAGPALAELGEGFPPSASPGTQSLPLIMTILVIGGLGLVAIVVLRKGRKKASETETDPPV